MSLHFCHVAIIETVAREAVAGKSDLVAHNLPVETRVLAEIIGGNGLRAAA